MKKQWYDYLWIFSLTYLILGFFNILFAWLGLICFFVPLIISVTKGTKGTKDGHKSSKYKWMGLYDRQKAAETDERKG